MNTAQCAHVKVILKHNDYPDGTRSDYWECDSGCGCRFYPEYFDQNIANRRDWFAGMALQGIIGFEGEPIGFNAVALECYKYADAMLLEREKGQTK